MQPTTPPGAGDDERTSIAGFARGQPVSGARAPEPGDHLGPYRLERLLGEGGMGQVWLAEQTAPFRRRVALKLMRRQLLGGLAEAYFEVERQALAGMDHPAIAKVYDAGRTDDGFPWFAMEWIDGAPLDAWCAQRRPALRERVRLGAALARGAQHAHQRGIVHRDLKPSNVLVQEVDGLAQPKIIDFGVAIGVGARSGAGSDASKSDRAGTRLYMSPEQLKGELSGIDTRSDVYALGMLLLVLLLPDADLRGLGDALREGDALRAALAEAVNGRGPAPLRAIPRELLHVVLRALQPQREDRYASAQALAEDLDRWLGGHALEAVPPHGAYRLRKFVRRHRTPLLAASAAVVALLAGLGAALFGLDRAEREAERSRAIADFLGSVLAGVDPDRAGELDKTLLRLVLDEAAARAAAELADEPAVLVEVESIIGNSYAGLADYERARAFKQAAYDRAMALEGRHSRTTIDTAAELGDAMVGDGDTDAGVALLRRAHEDAVEALGEDDPQTLHVGSMYGYALRDAGEFAAAQSLLEHSAQRQTELIGREHDETMETLYRLAIVYSDTEQFERAEPIYHELIEARTRLEGAERPRTLRLRNSLAVMYLQAKRFADGERVLKDILPANERVWGEDSPVTLTVVGNLGGALRQQGKVEESGPYYRRAAEISRQKLGDAHPRTLMSRSNYGNYLRDAGELEAAYTEHYAAVAGAQTGFGPEHAITGQLLMELGKTETLLGRFDDAHAHLVRSLEIKRAAYGEGHSRTRDSVDAIAALEQAREADAAR